MTASSVLPSSWDWCDGGTSSRTTDATLYAAIGTTYGAGDGSTTFNRPDMRGRAPVGLDSSQTEFDTLGEAYGAKTHTLTTAEMPAHDHGVAGKYAANLFSSTRAANAGSVGAFVVSSTAITAEGGGAAHNNIQPSRVVNFIIKT